MSFLKNIALLLGALLLLFFLAIGIYINFPGKPEKIELNYTNWNHGPVQHILPSYDHRQLLIKLSLQSPAKTALSLQVNNQSIPGKANDSAQRFWQFYTDSLQANTLYELQIKDEEGGSLTDSWTIKTFPHPDSTTDKVTILAFTCAGGVEDYLFGQEIFNPIPVRQALLKKGLSFNPQIIVANGDHVYWDQLSFQISLLKKLAARKRDRKYGSLNLDSPMLGPENLATFTGMVDAQIAELYGCFLREKSVFFLADDHDLLENDEALDELVTFPPKDYMLDAGRSTQLLYYPEFLPSTSKPGNLPDYLDQTRRLSTSFGSVQYGNLAEINLFDSKRFCDLNGNKGRLIPKTVEDWLINRTNNSPAKWLFQAPSTPIAWTAGKWQEWYPDVLDKSGQLSIRTEKKLWQKGWWDQHQRLLSALAGQNRVPIVLQGDLHMASVGKIQKSGQLDFSNNPIYAVGTGPLGTGKLGYPSSVRSTGAEIPKDMEVEELLPPTEKNGFTIIEVEKEQIRFKIFTWRTPQKIEDIPGLEPSFEFMIKSPSDQDE